MEDKSLRLEDTQTLHSENKQLQNQNVLLVQQLQELTTTMAEEAALREGLHQAIAQGNLHSIRIAFAAAIGSLGKAETAWAEWALHVAERLFFFFQEHGQADMIKRMFER
eukprot:gnl/MRDRNA2_/MRDRNA2_346988_c0_seq1.p1 gnl/MRDRNA2_/MRDRNA2_346988_c0~~gnl/MRDRNA2_/MRDRNA2_346988_c0_seq1.p1  ORF type:complete len:110 (+),score=29.95 gnl/MRDRNA2_/MRDRNA2_346988_c0_seq1:32-361(+)